jgi:transposase
MRLTKRDEHSGYGCGGRAGKIEEVRQREVRDLPWRKYQAVVIVEYYRVRCPQCGLKVKKVPQLPSKAPFSKDFEDAVGLACESAAARQVARQFSLSASTVRAIDLRYLERWTRSRKKPVLRQMGVDEIYLGKTQKFLTVVSNLETGEPLWFGRERKEETLDEFFRKQLSGIQRSRIAAACVDMWEPFTKSILKWAPDCRIVYDKFHVMQHANQAVDEVRTRGVFSEGRPDARADKRQALVATQSLGESGRQEATVTERSVPTEPPHDESVSAQGESGPPVDIPV